MVRTPGGHLTFKRIDKKPNLPKCADTGALLNGIRPHTAGTAKRVGRNKRTVSRVYGGVLSAGAVRDRYVPRFPSDPDVITPGFMRRRMACDGNDFPYRVFAGPILMRRVIHAQMISTRSFDTSSSLVFLALPPPYSQSSILRAFLVQEQKVVRELSKARKAAEAKKAAKAKKSEAAKAKAAKAGKAKNKAAKAAAKK